MVIEEPKWETFTDFGTMLSARQVHLFRINVEDCYSKIAGCYSDVLSGQELDRGSRFLHMEDRERYLVGRYYLRQILSCFVSSSPRELQFSTIGNKKPVLNGVEFSVSHSNKYVVVGVNLGQLGVDLEFVNPLFDFISMLQVCFDFEERLFIGRDTFRFFTLWTRKEAILKASSEGLTDDLAGIGSLKNTVSRIGVSYNIRTFQWDEGYVLSVAMAVSYTPFSYWHVS